MTDPQPADLLGKIAAFFDPSMRRGAKWGMIIGFAIASIVIKSNSPLGYYTGSLALVFGFFIGGGILAGLFIGWLASQSPDEGP